MAKAGTTDASEIRSIRFLLGSLLSLLALGLVLLLPFLAGTLFALAVGYLLQGPYRRVVRWVRFRGLAASLVTAAVVLLLCVPLVLVTWQLVNEVREVVRVASEGGYNDALASTLATFGVAPATSQQFLADAVHNAAAFVQDHALDTLGKLVRFLANVGIFVLMLFFVLRSGDDMAGMLRRAIPLGTERKERLLAQVGLRVRALFLGTFLVALMQGTAATLGWWILGFPNPFFWGFVMTILAVIPVVGPALVMVPAGLLAWAQGNTVPGVILILYGVVVVSLIDNLVRPYVVCRQSKVHPALVLLGTLGGLSVFGVTGFILGPLILSMVGPVFDEWERTRLEGKSLA